MDTESCTLLPHQRSQSMMIPFFISRKSLEIHMLIHISFLKGFLGQYYLFLKLFKGLLKAYFKGSYPFERLV